MRRHSVARSGAQRGVARLPVLTASSARTVMGSVLLAILLLGACATPGSTPGGSSDDPGGGDGESSLVSGDTETFATPEIEPTTPETSTGQAGNDNPAISVARLPIGGDSQVDETDPRLQCAHVTWIASSDGQIPRGTGVEITGVVFDPASFEAVGEGCGAQRPSCLHYVFRPSALQCDLAVRATGEVAAGSSPTLAFSGLVFCPDNASDSCRRFVAALADEQQLSIGLNIPELPPEPTTADPSTDPSTDSPATDAPPTDAPPTEAPTTDAPTTDATTTDGG